jgi:hypothetical protein
MDLSQIRVKLTLAVYLWVPIGTHKYLYILFLLDQGYIITGHMQNQRILALIQAALGLFTFVTEGVSDLVMGNGSG